MSVVALSTCSCKVEKYSKAYLMGNSALVIRYALPNRDVPGSNPNTNTINFFDKESSPRLGVNGHLPEGAGNFQCAQHVGAAFATL